MKKFAKIILVTLCALTFALPVMAGCERDRGDETPTEMTDYVSQVKLDMNSETRKQEVSVKFYIDGDTTHFNPEGTLDTDFMYGYINARYLAVNTPESTGVVEKWGKTASNFTHDKLASAKNILVESDDNNWNFDNNGRYLVWVWYIPADGTEWRNLNIELLQEGYGRSSKTAENRYGEMASAALYQAQQLKLNVFGNKTDPNYFGGIGQEMTIKYLRFHADELKQHPVCVTGIVTARFGNSVYIEEYDEQTGISYGISVFYGYKGGKLTKEILQVGNKIHVVGTVGDFNGTIQISDVDFNEARPTLTSNTTLISEKNPLPTTKMTAAQLNSTEPVEAEFTYEDENGDEQIDKLDLKFGDAVMCTYVTFENVTVTSSYTTPDGKSAGAMTIHCKDANGGAFDIRTEVLTKPDGSLYGEADLPSSFTSVCGVIDYYNGSYQLAVWDWSCFTIA